MSTTLCMVGGGRFAQKESRLYSTVGVAYFRNFPDGIIQTNLTTGEKFTFVISEPIENYLIH